MTGADSVALGNLGQAADTVGADRENLLDAAGVGAQKGDPAPVGGHGGLRGVRR